MSTFGSQGACYGLTAALSVLVGGGCAAPPLAAPEQLSFEVLEGEGDHFDVRAKWAASEGREPTRYRYRAGAEEDSSWSASGSVEWSEVLLSGVPAAGSYWFCVHGEDAARAGEYRCDAFDTPGKAPAAHQAGVRKHAGAAVAECDQPEPEWIWCDDFERDRMAAYFEASMPRRPGVGRDGSYAVVGRYRPERSEAGNLKLAFGRTPNGRFKPMGEAGRNFAEVYWRLYIKHPADWQGGGGDKLSRAMVLAGESRQQAMIAHVWSGTDPGPDSDYLKIDPASGTDSRGVLRAGRYNDFDKLRWLGARTGAVPLFRRNGAWHCIEARVRLNDSGKSNGVFELWIDGVLDGQRRDLNWIGAYAAYGINAVFLENYWNATSPVAQERYMDNLVVSTAHIGCGTD